MICCFSGPFADRLRVLSIADSILTFVAAVIAGILLLMGKAFAGYGGEEYAKKVSKQSGNQVAILLACFVIAFALAFLLYWSSQKKHYQACLCWIVITVILQFALFVITIISYFIDFLKDLNLAGRNERCEDWFTTGSVVTIYKIYEVWCAFAFLGELKNGGPSLNTPVQEENPIIIYMSYAPPPGPPQQISMTQTNSPNNGANIQTPM